MIFLLKRTNLTHYHTVKPMQLNLTALLIVKRNKALTEKIRIILDCSPRYIKEMVIKKNLPHLIRLDVLRVILKHTNFATVDDLVEN